MSDLEQSVNKKCGYFLSGQINWIEEIDGCRQWILPIAISKQSFGNIATRTVAFKHMFNFSL